MINRKVGMVPMAVGIAVGKKIREVREAAGYTLEELSLENVNIKITNTKNVDIEVVEFGTAKKADTA